MNKAQSNKLGSYLAVEALLRAATETAGLAGLPARLTALSQKIRDIYVVAQLQTSSTVGKTARRDQLVAAMIDATLEVAGAVGAFAENQGQPELAEAVAVRTSDFETARLVHRPWLAQRVHDAAQGAVAALADQGVTAETLAALQAKIDAVNAALAEPRTSLAERKAATARLARLFAEVDALLARQIDRLLLPLKASSPEFYATYQAARAVVSIGVRAASASTPAPAAGEAPDPVADTKAA